MQSLEVLQCDTRLSALTYLRGQRTSKFAVAGFRRGMDGLIMYDYVLRSKLAG